MMCYAYTIYIICNSNYNYYISISSYVTISTLYISSFITQCAFWLSIWTRLDPYLRTETSCANGTTSATKRNDQLS